MPPRPGTPIEQTSTKKIRQGNAALPVESSARRKNIQIFAKQGAPVIAVNDARVTATGTNRRLGRYIVIQDVYGNTFTYGQLGSVSKYYAVPKEQQLSTKQVREQLKPRPRPTPSRRPRPAPAASRAGCRRPSSAPPGSARPRRRSAVVRERLFAHPSRPDAMHHGGAAQLRANPRFTTFKDYFSVALGLKRKDVELKPLKKGSQVIGGTILGRIGKTDPTVAPHVLFEIHPAGKGSPRIDPSRSSTAGSCSRPPRSTAPPARTPSSAPTPRTRASARSC